MMRRRLGTGEWTVAVSHYQQLVSRLPACPPEQRAAFLARAVARAVRAFAATRPPGDARAGDLRAEVDGVLTRLPAGPPTPADLGPLDWVAEEVLRLSAADGDEGEPKDRVGFYTAAAAMLMSGVLTGRLREPQHAALCASHVIHVVEQVYDPDEAGRLEQDWQARALLADGGPLTAEAILALPDYDPGPARRPGRW